MFNRAESFNCLRKPGDGKMMKMLTLTKISDPVHPTAWNKDLKHRVKSSGSISNTWRLSSLRAQCLNMPKGDSMKVCP